VDRQASSAGGKRTTCRRKKPSLPITTSPLLREKKENQAFTVSFQLIGELCRGKKRAPHKFYDFKDRGRKEGEGPFGLCCLGKTAYSKGERRLRRRRVEKEKKKAPAYTDLICFEHIRGQKKQQVFSEREGGSLAQGNPRIPDPRRKKRIGRGGLTLIALQREGGEHNQRSSSDNPSKKGGENTNALTLSQPS